MPEVKERLPLHRIDCVPLFIEGSPEPLYSVWLQGRLLVPQTAQPIVDARDKLQRLGYTGHIEMWSPDKPFLIRVEPVRP